MKLHLAFPRTDADLTRWLEDEADRLKCSEQDVIRLALRREKEGYWRGRAEALESELALMRQALAVVAQAGLSHPRISVDGSASVATPAVPPPASTAPDESVGDWSF